MFASRVHNFESSFIREILSVTERPEIISFAGGLPDPEYFPSQTLQKCIQSVIQEHGPGLLQYAQTQGLPSLRTLIGNRFYQQSIAQESILITSGSQQALDLVARALLNPGDKVVMESPGYLGAIQTFRAAEVNLIPMPMEKEGPDLERLETILQEEQVKCLYTVPNFQNPTGISYSLEKRFALADLLRDREIYLIEDDPYRLLRYRGEDLPEISSMLPEQGIYLGSFSKTLAPGLRLGWVSAPERLLTHLIKLKQITDLHSSPLMQQAVVEFYQAGHWQDHLNQLITHYGEKLTLMLATLNRELLAGAEVLQPDGGMFVYVTLPEGMDTLQLVKKAIDLGVAFVPGVAFTVIPETSRSLRINFTNANRQGIKDGVARLGALLRG